MTFSQYRIIIEVFESFGILISGKWRYKSFYYDFHVSQLYIQALLFELELRLGIYLEEETKDGFTSPQAIVSALCKLDKNSMEYTLNLPNIEFAAEKKISCV